MVGSKSFRAFCHFLNPTYRLPQPRILPLYVSFIAEQTNLAVCRFLSKTKDVVLVFDEWSSRMQTHRIVLVLHFITDDWEYKSFVLGIPVLSRSFAETIADTIRTTLKDFECGAKVFASVGDGANTVTAAVKLTEIPNHFSCFAHALQFCFKVWMDGTILLITCLSLPQAAISGECDTALEILCAVVKRLHTSNVFSGMFREEVGSDTASIPLDNDTRWASRARMIQSALKLKEELDRAIEKNNDDDNAKPLKVLKQEHWEQLQLLHEVYSVS